MPKRRCLLGNFLAVPSSLSLVVIAVVEMGGGS
jgi:hypothetical protein